MEEERIADVVIRIVADHFHLSCADAARVKPETDLFDDLDGDSLDLVEIDMDIEEEFDIVLPDALLAGAHLVADLIALARRGQSTGGKP